jgi:hypothetical protein
MKRRHVIVTIAVLNASASAPEECLGPAEGTSLAGSRSEFAATSD